MPTATPRRYIDRCRRPRANDSRSTILTNRPNNRYLVQVGRLIPTKGVEKRSLRAVKIEVGG
jgi:hypothetical protein